MKTNEQKFYVTMTDRALSGWGKSANKINKLVLECDSYEIALRVYNKALSKKWMKYVNICDKKPYYNENKFYTNYIDSNNTSYESWYTE